MDSRAALVHHTDLAVLGLLQGLTALMQERKQQLENFIFLLQMLEPRAQSRPAPQPRIPPPPPRLEWEKPGRRRQWWGSFESDLAPAEDWVENFRMSRSSLLALSDELRPHLEKQTTVMRVPVSVLQQVACALFYLHDEAKLSKAAEAFGLSRATVSRIVRETCKAIVVHLSSKYLKLPFSEPEVEEMVAGFEGAHGMPQCLGAIDTTHIKIKHPSVKPRKYLNKRGAFSLNVQAVCDYRHRFMDVVVKWPGSVPDEHIFSSSKVNAYLQARTIPSVEKHLDENDAVPVYLLGHSAYPLLPYLMKEHRTKSTQEEHNFGRCICRARKVIDCAIGRLKARFGALRRPMDINLKDLPYVIYACFVLHNYCELNSETLDEKEVLRATRRDRDMQPPKERSSELEDTESQAWKVRNVLTKYLDS